MEVWASGTPGVSQRYVAQEQMAAAEGRGELIEVKLIQMEWGVGRGWQPETGKTQAEAKINKCWTRHVVTLAAS